MKDKIIKLLFGYGQAVLNNKYNPEKTADEIMGLWYDDLPIPEKVRTQIAQRLIEEYVNQLDMPSMDKSRELARIQGLRIWLDRREE